MANRLITSITSLVNQLTLLPALQLLIERSVEGNKAFKKATDGFGKQLHGSTV